MRIFLAGATGALGGRLVPQLVAAGHTVVGTTRSESKADRLRALGAEPAVLDPLDAAAVRAAVEAAAPDVLVHQLTALSGLGNNPRAFAKEFAETNRLRTEGTDVLLAAGRAAGVRRVVAQSYGGWPYARTGGPIKTETDPLDPTPAREAVAALAAIRHVEEATTGYGEGLALRYGGFYGPGTSLAPGGVHVAMVRDRKFPIVGAGDGHLVVLPHRRRGLGHRGGDRARCARRLQRRRRRAGTDPGVAAGAGRRDRGAAAPARAGLAGPAAARPAGDAAHADRARHVQREGEAGAGLDPGVPELAGRIPRAGRRAR